MVTWSSSVGNQTSNTKYNNCKDILFLRPYFIDAWFKQFYGNVFFFGYEDEYKTCDDIIGAIIS